MTDGIKSTELGWGDADGGDATVADKPAGAAAAPKSRPSLGSYEIRELLGRGGMGEVVLADDVGIGRQVAIKRMRSDEPTDAQIARFLREAKIQARLDHPAIVPVHELGRDASGRPYFTMKRLSGTTLSEVIRTGRESQQRMLRVFADVCFAIDFAHSRGVIHRDLKPSNVMLGDYGEVYVIDWGLARMTATAEPDDVTLTPSQDGLGGETQAGAVMGTPGYMSPEQVRGETVSTATDIYALGAILFEILTGARLHPSNQAALILTAEGGVHSPARATDRPVPPELDELCTRALAAQPFDRPTARALAEGVQHYLDGDRDLERRRALAAELLAKARADVDSGDPARRASAMKSAGRALALDPDSEAAGLVGKLMIEPPAAMPPELATRLDASDGDQEVVQSRSAMYALAAYFLFAPFMLWMGIRDWIAFGGLYLVLSASIASAWILTRWRRFPAEVPLAINAVLLVVLTQVTSPFLIAPTLTVVASISFIMLPRTQVRPFLVIGLYVAAMVVPLLLEAAGVWQTSWDIGNGRFVVSPSAVAFDGVPAAVFVIAVNISILIVVSLFVRQLAVSQRQGRRQLEMQAWHLAQLIPARG